MSSETREEGASRFARDPQDRERVSPCRRGKGNLTAGVYPWPGRRTRLLACLSGVNSCAVFYRVMQLFCSQII